MSPYGVVLLCCILTVAVVSRAHTELVCQSVCQNVCLSETYQYFQTFALIALSWSAENHKFTALTTLLRPTLMCVQGVSGSTAYVYLCCVCCSMFLPMPSMSSDVLFTLVDFSWLPDV